RGEGGKRERGPTTMPDWHWARTSRLAGAPWGGGPARDRLDLALLVSDSPASAAGVFTQNRVRAAPVRICQERLPRPDARGVVICSGNANACTGQRGLDDARRMAVVGAEVLDCAAEQMLVCSTGVIGRHLPMSAVESGIRSAVRQLADSPQGLSDAAHAILTTDTRIKVATRAISIAGTDVRLTGFAKGAAMIGPNMATMLAFVCADAAVAPEDLHTNARPPAPHTFH